MRSRKLRPEGTLRLKAEQEAAKNYAKIFENSSDTTEIKLQNFAKYIRRQDATRFLACYEIFKKILNIKGSIVECGVYRGFHFRNILGCHCIWNSIRWDG